jgi:hypothetical protein
MKEIIPCPFCGKLDSLEVIEIPRLTGFYQVICNVLEDGCGSSSGGYEDMQEPIEAWNMRADTSYYGRVNG